MQSTAHSSGHPQKCTKGNNKYKNHLFQKFFAKLNLCLIKINQFLTAIRFLVKVTVTVTIEPAVMLLLSSSSRTAKSQRGEKSDVTESSKSQRRTEKVMMYHTLYLSVNGTETNYQVLRIKKLTVLFENDVMKVMPAALVKTVWRVATKNWSTPGEMSHPSLTL